MSANTRAPSTIVTIALTGQTEFNIPFEYLARKYVEVTLLGIDRLPLVLNTDFRFVTKTLISLTRPYTADYTQIEIRRVTSATERLVDFHDGSILRAYDLNLSQIQTLHVAEEARDLTADTIGVNDEGHLDARNRKIVNVAFAESGGDAIPLAQVAQWNESALVSASRAENAAIAAEASSSAAHAAKDISVANAVQTGIDKATTQADAQITTENVVLTKADVVKSEAAALRAEAAAAPATALIERIDNAEIAVATAVSEANKASADVADVASQLSAAQDKIAELEARVVRIAVDEIWGGSVGQTGVTLTLSSSLLAGDILTIQHSDNAELTSAAVVIVPTGMTSGHEYYFPFSTGAATSLIYQDADNLVTNFFTEGYGIRRIYRTRAVLANS